MTRKKKTVLLTIIDGLIIIFGNILTTIILKNEGIGNYFIFSTCLMISIYFILVHYTNFYKTSYRYMKIKESSIFFIAILTTGFIEWLASLFLTIHYGFYIVISNLIVFLFLVGSRLAWKFIFELRHDVRYLNKNKKKNVLIIGAGNAGTLLIQHIQQDTKTTMNIKGFIDDDSEKQQMRYRGIKVIGTTKMIQEICRQEKIQTIILAIPSLNEKRKKELVDSLSNEPIELLQMPSFEKMLLESVEKKQPQKINILDVLGREEVQLDSEILHKNLKGKTILITGAGGSIGSEIVRQVCHFRPKTILLLGHGENSIYQILHEVKSIDVAPFSTIKFIPIIVSISDKTMINKVMKMYQPEIVYHAAAHKHVPLMECNIDEAIKNNIYGTLNVAEAAKRNNVETFVMISTDKAVRPTNVMGSTKRIAEMLVTELNDVGKTNFCAVRFGNVLGSRGSVIPLFKRQILAGGPVTITDKEMTRYFMTIPEASRLVIQAGALSIGGEIFVLDMGEPTKIIDLAKRMIELSGYSEMEITIKETGIRSGEKLYEELLVTKEKKPKQVFEKIFVGEIKGFLREEIDVFLNQLMTTDDQLKKINLIQFANESLN